MQFSVFSDDWLSLICLNENPHMDQLFTELLKNNYMVNHGLAAKLIETDLLLLRSLGRLFSYKKNHFFIVSKKFLQCNFNFV